MAPYPGGDDSRYQRQVRLPQIGRAGQERLAKARVAVVGLGALGCVVSDYLARAGVGHLTLVDRDLVEEGNLQRQLLFDEEDAREGIPKAEAARCRLQRANRRVRIEAASRHLDSGNAGELLDSSQLILDGTDNFETRFLLNDCSLEWGVPWIYGACIGSLGVVTPFVPRSTACLRCLVDPDDPAPEPSCETAGILGPAAGIVGSLQAAIALRLIVEGSTGGWGPMQVDVWSGRMISLAPPSAEPGCPACCEGKLEFLQGGRGSSSEVLCGREAVQILPKGGVPRDLEAAARTLADLGEVRRTPALVRAVVFGHTLSLFPDGRAIVFGTADPARARALLDRCLGGN
ncbi:MAG TPA: ThiF family adenylyltransferase [Candidatus Polarisedimenticolia bacterium]|nr:ThiF family adenylyltransferase [Candidatus Polarisedimenticolia bacterium]